MELQQGLLSPGTLPENHNLKLDCDDIYHGPEFIIYVFP
jgi:hypothetical protein